MQIILGSRSSRELHGITTIADEGWRGYVILGVCINAYMQAEGLDCLNAFDDDFDVAEKVYSLDTASNPYQPE